MRAIASCSARPLIDQPLMQRVLADMALDVAGATALSLPPGALLRRSGHRPRRGGVRPRDDAGRQILGLQDRAGAALRGDGVPRRQWLCRGRPLARYYREAPVNAIWEGSGNVMALDVLRVLDRAPAAFRRGAGRHRARSRAWRAGHGRRAARRHAGRRDRRRCGAHPDRATGAVGRRRPSCGIWQPDAIADAFIETRLAGQWRTTYGMLDARHDAKDIISSLYPAAG